MITFLQSLFADKLIVDNREVWTSFQFPGFDGTFLVYLPCADVWNQLALFFLIQVAFLAVFAAIIFKFIIPNRGKSFTYLLGYGILIPISIYLPLLLIDILDIQNRQIRMGGAILANIVTFRCIEAMHATSPPVTETSLRHYQLYYSNLGDFAWNEKTKWIDKVTLKDVGVNFLRIVTHYALMSLSISFMQHYNYKPFESDVQLDHYHLSLDLFRPSHLINNYCLAVMTFYSLSVGFNLMIFGNNVALGLLTKPVFRNPLWTSKSPSDFWGYRWNMIIHETMKRGIFRPIRNAGYPAAVGIIAAFIASGLLHDYTWLLMFRSSIDERQECADCWYPQVGKQTAFFLWCGFTMLLERPVNRWIPVIPWMARNLPRPLISTLVVLTALPIAHWYPGDWVVGNAFDHMSIGTFRVVYEAST